MAAIAADQLVVSAAELPLFKELVEQYAAINVHHLVVVDTNVSRQPHRQLCYPASMTFCLAVPEFEGTRPDDLLARGDKMSMAVSLEARVPLLDREVIDTSLRIDPFESMRNGTRKVVMATSGGCIYGEPDASRLPVTEEQVFLPEAMPESPYGVSKKVALDYLRYYKAVQGLDYTALALSNVYGPRQEPAAEVGLEGVRAERFLAPPDVFEEPPDHIRDEQGVDIGWVQQENQSKFRKVLRFLTSLDQFLTHHLGIYDGSGQKVIALTRPGKIFKSRVVIDEPDGRKWPLFQATAPSLLRAHVWKTPAVTCDTEASPAGGVAWPGSAARGRGGAELPGRRGPCRRRAGARCGGAS